MSKHRLALLLVLLLLGVLAWQLPRILKSIPSRYVAAYLPEPIQTLAARDHVELLPTAPAGASSGSLPITEAIPELLAQVADSSVSNSPTRDEQVPENLIQIPENPQSDASSQSSPSDIPPPTPTAQPLIPTASRLVSFDHQFQTWNNCGPATLAMGLSFFGLNLDQRETAAVLKPNPEDRNVGPLEMAAFVNDESELSAISRVNGDLGTLKRFVASGYPVIVELGLDPPGEYRWMGWYGHYLLIVAYDDAAERFWAYDSWFGTSELPVGNADSDGREVAYEELDKYWRQFNRSYIVLFRPEREADVANIVGPDMDSTHMWETALVEAKQEIESEPENAFLWFNLGTIYNELEDFELSAAAFDQARSIGLPWRMLWYQFGPFEAYYQVGRYEDVIVLADVTLQDRPYFEESYYYKGLALDASGERGQAISNLEKAIRFNPNFEPATVALVELQDQG